MQMQMTGNLGTIDDIDEEILAKMNRRTITMEGDQGKEDRREHDVHGVVLSLTVLYCSKLRMCGVDRVKGVCARVVANELGRGKTYRP
jgi:hypothetical protein